MPSIKHTTCTLVMVLGLLASRNAHAASISIAGADCGTPPFLGLQFIVGPTGASSSSTACPGIPGSLLGPLGGSLYGPVISSVGFTITGNAPFDFSGDDFPGSLHVGSGSALTSLVTTSGDATMVRTFVLSGGPGISIFCLSTFDTAPTDSAPLIACRPDAVIVFSGFAPGTSFEVSEVNGIAAVPEPATLTLVATSLAAAALRRRRRTAGSR